jgi:hypothetical protein
MHSRVFQGKAIRLRPAIMKRSDDELSSFAWWGSQRLRYNKGLVLAGLLAFAAYAAVGYTLLPSEAGFEITLLTALFQGLGYLAMMGVANLFYFIGPISERMLRPIDVLRYRRVCFRLGLWFSLALPFCIPVALAVLALVYPDQA